MRTAVIASLTAGMVACEYNKDVVIDDGRICETTIVEISEEESSRGFTADEALAALPDLLPNHITWTSLSAGQTEADLSWGIGDRVGAPEMVTEHGGAGTEEFCDSEPVMRLHVTMGVSLADGSVSGSGIVVFDFQGLTADTVEPFENDGESSRIEVALNSPYAEELETHIAGKEGPPKELEQVYFMASGTLSEAVVDLEALYSPEGLEAVYRGEWSRVED